MAMGWVSSWVGLARGLGWSNFSILMVDWCFGSENKSWFWCVTWIGLGQVALLPVWFGLETWWVGLGSKLGTHSHFWMVCNQPCLCSPSGSFPWRRVFPPPFPFFCWQIRRTFAILPVPSGLPAEHRRSATCRGTEKDNGQHIASTEKN